MTTDFRRVSLLKQKNPQDVRAEATALRALKFAGWTDWELDFLEDRQRQTQPLSTRQAEILLGLADSARLLSQIGGFSIRLLIANTWAERHVFDPFDDADDLSFLERAVETARDVAPGAPVSLRYRHCRRLVKLARRAGVIEQHQGA